MFATLGLLLNHFPLLRIDQLVTFRAWPLADSFCSFKTQQQGVLPPSGRPPTKFLWSQSVESLLFLGGLKTHTPSGSFVSPSLFLWVSLSSAKTYRNGFSC